MHKHSTEKITVSIIVPVFNADRYLYECLQSISSQSYNNIEIICINDGSSDHSLEIINSFATMDSRIKVISKENGGLSSARNAGLNVSSGEFITFVDADDILDPHAIKTMIEAITLDNADILVFGTQIFPFDPTSNRDTQIAKKMIPAKKNYSGKDICEIALFEEHTCSVHVWNKIYRRTLFAHGIRFDEEILFGEDRCFLFDIFPFAEKLGLIETPLYNYRQSTSSLTGQLAKKPFERAKWKVKLINHIFRHWYSDYPHITAGAKVKLIEWSDNYLKRSVAALTSCESRQIMQEYQRIVETYVR